MIKVRITILFVFLLSGNIVSAQVKLDTLKIAVNKTSQFILDAPIIKKSVDVASGLIDVSHKGSELLVYAKKNDFYPTNLSFKTFKGGKKYFYMFILVYDEDHPNLLIPKTSDDAIYRQTLSNTEEEELMDSEMVNSPSQPNKTTSKEEYLPSNSITILANEVFNKSITHNPPLGKAFSNKMQMTVDAIYVKGDKIFFRINLRNDSSIPYDISMINFSVGPKGGGKRSVGDDTLLNISHPSREDYEKTIRENEMYTKVFVLDRFTFSDKERLFIDFRERDGDRDLSIDIRLKDLLKAGNL